MNESKMLADPREILDLLLEGYRLTPEELEDLVARFPGEGQYHDYKDGKQTSNKATKQAAREIRQWVSGFANADGGILIIGVAEGRPRLISPCQPRGSEPLDKWAEGLLHDMLPFFSLQPRIHLVQYPEGTVVVIAIARAPVLVPCIESGKLRYFLRFNQSTYVLPDYLLSDLVLGRRQNPIVKVKVSSDQLPPYLEEPTWRPTLFFSAENLGFAPAEGLDLGFVTWGVGSYEEKVNSLLLSYIELGEKPDIGGLEWRLHHETTQPKPSGTNRLPPFGRVSFAPLKNITFPFIERRVEILAGVYFLSRETLPQWFQLRFVCEREFGEVSRSSPPVIRDFETTRLLGRRARVQCNQF